MMSPRPRRGWSSRSRLAAVGVLVLVAAATGVTVVVNHLTAPPSATPKPTSLKAHMTGIVRENGIPPTAGWSGYVASLKWKDFEPSEGHFILPSDTKRVIDAGTAANLPVKVRFFAGIDAPSWLVGRVGTFQYTEGQSGKVYTMLKFWDSRVSTAYAAAQVAESGLLDTNATVREVTMSDGMTVYAEPMQSIGRASYAEDVAAGMTDASFVATLRAGIDAHKVWKRTNTDLAVNPQHGIEAGIMDYFRRTLGPGAVLENNSIRDTSRPGGVYAEMLERGPPISFQTASLTRVGSLTATLEFAASQKAMSVETDSAMTVTQLGMYNSRLAANAPQGG